MRGKERANEESGTGGRWTSCKRTQCYEGKQGGRVVEEGGGGRLDSRLFFSLLYSVQWTQDQMVFSSEKS